MVTVSVSSSCVMGKAAVCKGDYCKLSQLKDHEHVHFTSLWKSSILFFLGGGGVRRGGGGGGEGGGSSVVRAPDS